MSAGVTVQPPAKLADDDDGSQACHTPQPAHEPAAAGRRHVVPRQPGHAAKPPLSPMIAAARPKTLGKSNLGECASLRADQRAFPLPRSQSLHVDYAAPAVPNNMGGEAAP